MNAKSRGQVAIGGSPRVDLMPPEVATRRRDRSVQSWAILALILVVLVVAAGTALAAFANTIAQSDLMTARAHTEALLAEQQSYSEVTDLKSSIALSEQARSASVTAEVIWLDVQRDIESALPPGVVIAQISGSSQLPWQTNLAPTSPLRMPRVATLSITVNSGTLGEAAAFVTALQKLPIATDVTADSLQLATGYVTMVTVNINEIALSARFTEKYQPRHPEPKSPIGPTPTPTSPVVPTPTPTTGTQG